MNIGRNIGIFTSPTSWLSTLNWIYFQIWLSAVNALYSIWLAVFFHFRFLGYQTCFFFFKLLLALIATSFLNVNENFLWFFLCSIFFELLFKTEQKSVVIYVSIWLNTREVFKFWATFDFWPWKKTPSHW